MSLYLTSSFRGRGVADLVLGDIEKKIGKPTTEIKVLYIITAGNLHPEAERDWIIEGRQILQKYGCQIFDYDIEGKTEQEVETATQGMDVIFCARWSVHLYVGAGTEMSSGGYREASVGARSIVYRRKYRVDYRW